MDELRRLVDFATDRRGKAAGITFFDETSLEYKLVSLIKNKVVRTDAEAAEALYGHQGNTKGYRMLKSRLKKKLFAIVPLLDFQYDNLKNYYLQEQECSAQLLQATILSQIGEFELAEKKSRQALLLASEYDFNYIAVGALEILRMLAAYKLNASSYEQYEAKLEEFKRIVHSEEQARSIYLQSRIKFHNLVSERSKYLAEMPDILEKLRLLWVNSGSNLIYEYYTRMRLTYYELTGAYEAIIEVIKENRNLLEQGELNEKRVDFKFIQFIYVYACLKTKKYQEGITCAEESVKLFPPNHINLFTFLENYFLLAMHSENYDLAYDILARVQENENFQFAAIEAKVRWALYVKAYNLTGSNKVLTNFKLENNKEIYSLLYKDKQGFNLTLLLLEALELLQKQKYDTFEAHLERLRKYYINHLQTGRVVRERILLKLLFLIIKAEFDELSCRSRGKILLKQLSNTPVPGDAYAEVEIIPYEHLWELILKSLKYNSTT